MLLTVQERMVLPSLLPVEGNFLTLKILRELREALSFNEAEMKEFGVEQEGTQVRWDAAKAKEKDITIGDTMKGVVVTALKKLDSDGKLRNEHLTLFEKFVE